MTLWTKIQKKKCKETHTKCEQINCGGGGSMKWSYVLEMLPSQNNIKFKDCTYDF